MSKLLLPIFTLLFGTALSQVSQQSLNFSCANNYSASNCLNPCIFTPDPNSFVCASNCNSLKTPQDCSTQSTCTFTQGYCQLVANTCSNIQGPSITIDQCLGQNSACQFTPYIPATCTVLDNVTSTCQSHADYYSCKNDSNCQFTDTDMKCSFQANTSICADPKNCDPKYCDPPLCAFPGLKCDPDPANCSSQQCTINNGVCIDKCNLDTTCSGGCQKGNQCTVNTNTGSTTCSASKSDDECANNTNCKVSSKGTCKVKDNLCQLSSCNQNLSICKYTAPINPICQNPTCKSQNYLKCDPGCQGIYPQCTPNGLSLCQGKQNAYDCANSTFCQFTQSGTCATAVASFKLIIQFITSSLILCLFL
ncbi:hypothetical protein ABPG74_007222 [Tetrahymena malaccensis]